MPVTWCYQVQETQHFCSTGFPMGCYVNTAGDPKDACNINVRNVFYVFFLFLSNI